MHKFKLILLGLVVPFTVFHVHAEELQYINDGTIHYYCDDKKSIFYFFAEPRAHYPNSVKKYDINIDSLLISKEDSEGNITRLGSRKDIRQCGNIKLVFESGFYNANTQGLLGLLDYPLLSVSINGKSIFNNKILNLCASGGSRTVCPSDSAIQSIEITKKTSKLYKMALTTAIPQDKNESFRLEKKNVQLKVK
nr:hypothetical protein [Acinetobacter sp. Marseille-Q1620]